jgi:hypothetical protein
MSEQTVGEGAITMMGSAVSTSSQSRCTCDNTGQKFLNKFTSCTETLKVGEGVVVRLLLGELGDTRQLVLLGICVCNTNFVTK